jgi:protein-S-isoprenylcysteine O-methyltransferase Ste14
LSAVNPADALTKAVGLLCYVTALAGAAVFAVRLFLLGLGLTADRFPPPWNWAIDLGWLLLFGLQHSGMARAGFKRFWLRFVPARLERSFYAALSGLILIGLVVTWQVIPGPPLWTAPTWLIAVPLLAGLGLALVNLRFDHAGLFGLRQAWQTSEPPDQLLIVGPYRYVRHPLMACLLVVLWAQPVMTPTLALLSGGLTLYIMVGVVLEERDLLKRFGPVYAVYRRRVPAVVPWRPPVEAAVHPARDVP